MKNNNCLICNKRISSQAKRCKSCAKKELYKNPENNPNFKGNKARKRQKYYCIDCNKEITYKTCKCGQDKYRSCSKKGKNNGNFKGGKPKCIDCGKQLNKYKNNRCWECYLIWIENPKNSSNYIDGRTSLQVSIRNLVEFKNWRKQIFKRDNYTCQDCKDSKRGALEAHHKIQFAELLAEFLKEYDQFSPIEDKETLVRLAMKWQPFWNIDNGITLCKKCHKKIRRNRWIILK